MGAAFTPQVVSSFSVSLVQGGIPTWLYERGQADETWQPISEIIYTKLTDRAPPADLTIWPETAVDETFEYGNAYASRLEHLAEQRGALLVGSRRLEDETLYNSAILLQTDSVEAVNKKRLAMGAESHFAVGEGLAAFQYRAWKLGVVFCLESVMPVYAGDLVEYEKADVLVVMADGSRFGNTLVGKMHARRSTLRAVESGRSVIHVGQHGFTHVVSALGARSQMLPAFVGQTLSQDIEVYQGTTPFMRLRHAIGYGLMLMVLLAVFFRFFRKSQITP